MAQPGQQVKVTYVGTFDDGTIFDSTESHDEPLKFVVGSRDIIAGFDAAVREMEIGDTKMVTIEPKDAYGDYDPSALQTYEISELPNGDELAKNVGRTLYFQDKSEVYPATIVSAEGGNITIDYNHPMAGKRLNFEITLVEVSDEPDFPYAKPVPEPEMPPKPGELA